MKTVGINPQTLRGTKTGVYIGHSSMGMPDGIPSEIQHDSRTSIKDTAYWIPGTAKSMYSNRISFFFDFKGPSSVIDTACSSSMVALDMAVTDLRLGNYQYSTLRILALILNFFVEISFLLTLNIQWNESQNELIKYETILIFSRNHFFIFQANVNRQ